MSQQDEIFPNYELQPNSPRVSGVGLVLSLPRAHPSRGEPIVLRGAYVVDAAFMRACGGEPLTWLMIVVVRRDEPAGQIRVVMDGHNLPPGPDDPGPPPDPSVRQGGFFNLDLSKVVAIIKDGGRYWVMASLGDHVSPRIEFETSA